MSAEKEYLERVAALPNHPPVVPVHSVESATTARSVVVEDVSRSFGATSVVHGVTFSVAEGEVFGVIGPSGCGKTTLIKMIVGLLKPTEGKLLVWGTPPAAFTSAQRRSLGYMAQGFVLYPTLTVEQNARFSAGLYGMGWLHRRRRIRQVLHQFDLWSARRRLARNISGGMQRRLSLAAAVLHEPRLLVVDEPSAGLDPLLRSRVWSVLNDLRQRGTTVIVTTQNLDDANLCDRVAFMRAGQLLATGTPGELKRLAIGGEAVDIDSDSLARADLDELLRLPGVRQARTLGWASVRVIVDDAGASTVVISEWLRRRGIENASVRTHEPTFDEAFLSLVNKPAGEAA